MKQFASNKSLIVSKPDKGRAVVIMNRADYVSSMNNVINDLSKFEPIDIPVEKYSRQIEDKINNFLRKIKNLISSEIYQKLRVTGSGPGVLYGLPKIHKPDFNTKFQLRPIFAAYNTASFALSKFLVPILSSLTTNSYTLDCSSSFVKEIVTIPNAKNYTMASFDVTNLFTNVPLNETIEICLNSLFSNSNATVLGLCRNLFKKLLENAVMNTYFLFDGKLYRQKDGLGMGLPLGPTFANVFLCKNESEWLNDCPLEFKPAYYRRYIDDTFLLFHHESHASKFLEYLNSKHPNINFTCELETEGKISFLDCNINKNSGNFSTSVYRKSSFSGLGLSFFSFSWYRFKLNSVKSLLNRAYHICSNFGSLHDEFLFLTNFL